jgi:hypothetical protein
VPSHVVSASHTRSEVAVGAVNAYWVVPSHVVSSEHARLVVAVAAVVSYWVVPSHVVSAVHARLVVAVGAVGSYWTEVHAVAWAKQLTCPVWPWYWPAAQSVQLPGDPYVPAAQGPEEAHTRFEVAVGAVVSYSVPLHVVCGAHAAAAAAL